MNRDFIARHDDADYLFDNGFDGGWNGDVVKTCVTFWIRRSVGAPRRNSLTDLKRS
jgi:hypothetical protein